MIYVSKIYFIGWILLYIYPILQHAEINSLSPEDAVLDYGSLGNFSLAGFEMVLTRYVSTYIITYYLPSGIQTSYSLCTVCLMYCF